jgi:hypothetical protein
MRINSWFWAYETVCNLICKGFSSQINNHFETQKFRLTGVILISTIDYNVRLCAKFNFACRLSRASNTTKVIKNQPRYYSLRQLKVMHVIMPNGVMKHVVRNMSIIFR